MDSLEQALHRLTAAVRRVDAAVDRREARAQNVQLTLEAHLRHAETERDELHGVMDGVSARLDGAIERLHLVLEH